MTPHGMELLGSDDLATSDDAATATRTAPCPIVGVGASAGGLEQRRPMPASPMVAVKESFGTRLIRNAIVYDLQGECAYELSPNGVTSTLAAPF